MAMLIVPPPLLMNSNIVPMGNATLALAGIVIVNPEDVDMNPVLAEDSVIEGLLDEKVDMGVPAESETPLTKSPVTLIVPTPWSPPVGAPITRPVLNVATLVVLQETVRLLAADRYKPLTGSVALVKFKLPTLSPVLVLSIFEAIAVDMLPYSVSKAAPLMTA